MSSSDMTYRDLRHIVDLINSTSHFSEFRVKTDQLELEIKRGTGNTEARPPVPGPDLPPAKEPEADRGAAPAVQDEPAAKVARDKPVSPENDVPEDAILITSPMVGTFYRSPEPGAAPFVELGQDVDANETVCLIEVMKLINSITAPCAGKVTHILVADGDPVEYGQALIALAPQ